MKRKQLNKECDENESSEERQRHSRDSFENESIIVRRWKEANSQPRKRGTSKRILGGW